MKCLKLDSKNVEKHLEEFNKIVVQLKLISHDISAVILAQNLLDTLDQHDFSYFVSSFAILGGKREIEVDEVKLAFRSEIAARQQRGVLKPPITPIPSTAICIHKAIKTMVAEIIEVFVIVGEDQINEVEDFTNQILRRIRQPRISRTKIKEENEITFVVWDRMRTAVSNSLYQVFSMLQPRTFWKGLPSLWRSEAGKPCGRQSAISV